MVTKINPCGTSKSISIKSLKCKPTLVFCFFVIEKGRNKGHRFSIEPQSFNFVINKPLGMQSKALLSIVSPYFDHL